MKKLSFYLFLLAIVIEGNLFAQSQAELEQLMRNRGEYYFTLSINDPTQIKLLSSLCSVDGTDGRIVICYANQEEYDKLLSLGFEPVLDTPPSLRANVTMWDGQGTYNWNAYLTYDQYVAMMQGFPSKAISGRTCTLFSLGTLSTTINGIQNHRQLLGVRINNGSPEGKPKFLYSSTMHGDEITGMILMLRLINELCTSTDSQIVDLVNNLDIYILPLTNPDGTYKGGNSTVNSAQRYNGNNKDLNRNYKDYFEGNHPDGNAYQDETLWTMAFADSLLFTMGGNYHGGAEVMNYPWDPVYTDHADKDWYEYVCTRYVQVARQTYSSYMSDTYSDGVTNGATWYTISGSRQDYMNAYAQCREVTVECSSVKTPSASQLPSYWNYNHYAMLAFMEQARNGIHGIVRDALTNQPIVGAKVTVLNHDTETSFVTTHDVGDFHRPIKGGSWTIKVTKDGYCPQTLDVTVADDQRVDLDVYLYPEGDCPVIVDCYEQTTPTASGSYVMGYLNDSTLVMPTHNGGTSATATSVEVTGTDNGFSVAQDALPGLYTLTANGSNGQYYIQYNNRYLTVSSSYYSANLAWSNSATRWYINANGIYTNSNNRTYYLYYNNGSFAISTEQHNNITFYVAGDCPTDTPVEQTFTLAAGWNWFVPTVDITLSQLEEALGASGIIIMSQESGYASYEDEEWSGTLQSLVPGQVYNIQVSADCSFSLSGSALSSVTVTIVQGYNWIGYTGSQPISIEEALAGFAPSEGDSIISFDEGFTNFEDGEWSGTLTHLHPGQGYIYISNDPTPKQITFYQ